MHLYPNKIYLQYIHMSCHPDNTSNSAFGNIFRFSVSFIITILTLFSCLNTLAAVISDNEVCDCILLLNITCENHIRYCLRDFTQSCRALFQH